MRYVRPSFGTRQSDQAERRLQAYENRCRHPEIVLWTADQQRSLQFYRDLLGLEVISPAGLPNVFLKVGEGNAGIPQMIVLVPKTQEILARSSGYQLHHMALELPDDRFDT